MRAFVVLIFLASASFASKLPLVTWTMINVNEGNLQGDAHLLEFVDGTRVLVDAGNSENALVRFFQANGIDSLTRIAVTHAHKDHYQGIPKLFEAGVKFSGPVWMNFPEKKQCEAERPWGCDWEDLEAFKASLTQKQISTRSYGRGDILYRGHQNQPLELRTLYAFNDQNSPVGKFDVNSTSAVMRLTAGKTRALFTGDLNTQVSEFLAYYGRELEADIIKIPHHGGESAATNSFYDRVGARFALIPGPAWLWADKRGRPVRDYLTQKGTPHLVNGLNGTVRVRIYEDRFEIKPDRGTAFVSFQSTPEPRRSVEGIHP